MESLRSTARITRPADERLRGGMPGQRVRGTLDILEAGPHSPLVEERS